MFGGAVTLKSSYQYYECDCVKCNGYIVDHGSSWAL